MLFALLCTDKPGALQLRLDTRPDHLAYLEDLNARGILKVAGPFLGEDGKPTGSLVIVKTETIEEAKAIAEADPYAKAGLFANVEVKAYNWVFNNPEA
ncbi:YciI-like protein [Sinorhizobium alkalisoli]|uniref:YciI-like protein n=1 Tax=Sinorhizobium alkalisoli TaxID=1752398 RepID=UPI00124C9353|nr:YciI-like protein [Sinorhizobium alkalisoli]MCA1492608.1 YciI family protein [Ensifer sp. NBAIM29]QFI67899.1 YciL protein [Sinorhizobium alkalisoli]